MESDPGTIHRTAESDTDGIIVIKRNGAGSRSYFLQLALSNDTLRLNVSDDGTNSVSRDVTFSGAFPNGSWNHIAVTYDASAGQMELFVNGSSLRIFLGPVPGTTSTATSSALWFIS